MQPMSVATQRQRHSAGCTWSAWTKLRVRNCRALDCMMGLLTLLVKTSRLCNVDGHSIRLKCICTCYSKVDGGTHGASRGEIAFRFSRRIKH